MDKFLKRGFTMVESSTSISQKKHSSVEIDFDNFPADPGKRPAICSYDANCRDKVRRVYLLKGPFQPRHHTFPWNQSEDKNQKRRFIASWFDNYPDWLEYSITEDRAYCLYCYLFRTQSNQGGADSFVGVGFNNWKKKERFEVHVGAHNSLHNQTRKKCEDLMNQNLTGSVSALFTHKEKKDRARYRIRLNAAVATSRLLLKQGLAFRGNDESAFSRNRGNYLELFHLLAEFNEEVNNVSFEFVEEDGLSEQRVEADMLVDAIQSFKFAFVMHLMTRVLGITHELSQALQKKEQKIDNAMRLVQISKQRLQDLRDNGWDSLLNEVASFCSTHEILIPKMSEKFPGKRRTEEKTNEAYFRIELFCGVLDKQLMELNSRFSVKISELLYFVGCLNPRDSFFAFNKESLVNFARLYPREFSTTDLVILENQLETYIIDMRSSVEFSDIDGIGDLAKKMVETKRHRIYPLVYTLLALALTLPVATATVERAFSAMKIIKNRLRTRMSDDRLNSCLVTYIEKEVLDEISNEAVMQRFQSMKFRREQL